MNLTEHRSKKNAQLFGYRVNCFLSNLILKEEFPRAIFFSGEKGIGKSTLINHLMYFYFDKENYDVDLISSNQVLFINNSCNIFPNIFILMDQTLKM